MSIMAKFLGLIGFSELAAARSVLGDFHVPRLLSVERSLTVEFARPWFSPTEARQFDLKAQEAKAFNESLARLPILR